MCDIHLFVFFSYNCLISADGLTSATMQDKISSARFIHSIWTSVHCIHIILLLFVSQ